MITPYKGLKYNTASMHAKIAKQQLTNLSAAKVALEEKNNPIYIYKESPSTATAVANSMGGLGITITIRCTVETAKDLTAVGAQDLASHFVPRGLKLNPGDLVTVEFSNQNHGAGYQYLVN